MYEYRKSQPALMVVFGASGDLAQRKLIPALYNLYAQKLLPKEFALIGFARSSFTDESFRDLASEGIRQYAADGFDEALWQEFAARLFYQSGSYEDLASFQKLAERVERLDAQFETQGNRLFYLSTPPNVFMPIASLVHEVKLSAVTGAAWARIIIEKPFGHDLASAQELNQHLSQLFSEEQIYRIDHYLGKETVQNILVFRFGNGIFEPIWNRNYVDHVQITVAEELGIGDRGGYYDKSGALRDMVQNHLMQLVALTAMEPPVAFDAKAVRDQKVNVMRSIRPLTSEAVKRDLVRAQYSAGYVGGVPIQSYQESKGVDAGSTTDTFVAWRLEIDNWRWSGVPFYIRTGKALPSKVTEINIVFRRPPLMFFSDLDADYHLPRNALTLRIQPNEGIFLSFDAKRPGPLVDVDPVTMSFAYSTSFGVKSADAYERLLLDALLGDGTLFIRRDEIEVAWDRVTRVLDVWSSQDEKARQRGRLLRLPTYAAGTWGPREADELLSIDGRYWRDPV